MSVDLTNYGVAYAKEFYGQKLWYDGGAIAIEPSGILNLSQAAKQTVVRGTFTVDQTSTLSGDLTLNANADFNGTLDVSGQTDLAAPAVPTTVRGPFNVNQATTLSGDLTLNANADFNGELDVSGEVNLGAVDNVTTIRGNLIVDGLILGANVENSILSSLTVNGPSDLNGNLDVSGPVSLAAFGVATTVRGSLNVAQNADLDGTLDVAGQTDLAAPGVATTVRGSLTVDQNADLDGTLDVAGQTDLAASGVDTNVRGPLNVTEETTLSDDLILNANADFNGTLDVIGQVDLGNTGVATNVRGPLNVTEAVEFSGDLVVNGNSDLNGQLDVSGQTDLAAPGITTTIRGHLNVDQNADLDGTLDVAGQTDLAAIGVATNVRGSLNVAQNSDFDGTLDVAGQTLLGNAGGSADTTVRGSLNVNEDLDVTKHVYLGSTGGAGDVTVRGSVTINESVNILGNLSVAGNVTSVDSVTVTVGDNLIVVNSGPDGSKDGGFLVERFQEENATASGDVIQDTPAATGTASAVTGTSITLAAGSSALDDYYNDWWVLITGATAGQNQVRKIIDYTGATRIATVNAWDTNPTGTVTYSLFNRPYVGSFYDESTDKWVLAATVGDPGSGSVSIQDHIDLQVGGVIVDDILDVNGAVDCDVATFAVDSTTNAANAIYFRANGGTTETLKLQSSQGTSDNSIDIVSDNGGITLNASKINTIGDLNVEPSGDLDGNPSTYHLYFGEKNTEGCWRIGISNNNRLTFDRYDGATYVTKARIG